MASIRERAAGTWEVRFQKTGVLAKAVYLTADTEAEARRIAARFDALLAVGVVPAELRGADGAPTTLGEVLDAYADAPGLSASEKELIPPLYTLVARVRLAQVNFDWVEAWVKSLTHLAFSTVTKRVGCLARAMDFGARKGWVSGENPVRMLQRGYASAAGARKTWEGERERRLEPTEEGAIRSALMKTEERLLFDMALETAMRMSEMTSLKAGQIDLAARTIFLDRTKNGSKRQVPVSSVLLKILRDYLPSLQSEYVFPSWGGLAKNISKNRVSHLFASRFEKAGVANFHFHDLRHEATSRLYERTTLSDLEIVKITGHRQLRMLQRYANLRGSNLAEKLW